MTSLCLAVLGLDPRSLLDTKFALVVLFAIVFAESGLLVGFFLPGDSLLFSAGLLIATGTLKQNILVTILVIIAAAISGDQVGYRIGHKIGPALFTRPKSRLFDPKNAVKARDFFEKYGVKTIVMARFVPIVRTFAPVVAGVGQMKSKVFSTYNVVGGVLWGTTVPLAGYFLGKRFPILEKRIDLVAVIIVAVSLIPVAVEFLKERKHKATTLS
jgi:membrane-associated protein